MGPCKLDLLNEATRIADVGTVSFIPKPVAAAIHYSDLERMSPGDFVAVYDFREGTFDASVLRMTDTTFELVGDPAGMDRLGGIDLDEAVFGHVRRVVGVAVDDLDSDDPSPLAALAKLRERVVSPRKRSPQTPT